MSRFLDPFYALNAALVVPCLVALHLYWASHWPEGNKGFGRLHSAAEFYSWEKQAVATLLAVVAWKGLRRRSVDHFAQQFFFWGKVVVALSALMVDVRLSVWYIMAVWACSATCPQPMLPLIKSGGGEAVTLLDPTKMREFVLKGEDAWLVLLYTEQHADSIAVAPVFSDLAERFGSERLLFGVMDACLWPGYTKDALRVSPNVWDAQLPAVVLYARGKEVGRIPAAPRGGDGWIRTNFFTKRDVIKRFGLSEQGAAAAAPKGSKARGASAAAAGAKPKQ